MKLNVKLALTDQLRQNYKNLVNDYSKFFAKSQGAFKGEKRTYTPKEGTIDDPSKRGNILVAITVHEKLDYFINNSSKFIDALFSQEKTNSLGLAKAELKVNGESWGEFTSFELLRLKSLIESSDLGKLGEMLENIPVRPDSEVWNKTNEDEYSGRDIYETEKFTGVAKTTIKTPYVLEDPNMKGRELPSNYTPPVVTRDEIHELGDYTKQNFSGEWTHRQRALCLKRRSELITSITEALKIANECESVESELTAEKIFNYLFFGE
jgi:hypothetical protein